MLCQAKPSSTFLKGQFHNVLSITMEFLGLKVPSLLDSGSMVMLIHEAYFNKHILPLLHGSAEELAEAHLLFQLSAVNKQSRHASFEVFQG